MGGEAADEGEVLGVGLDELGGLGEACLVGLLDLHVVKNIKTSATEN